MRALPGRESRVAFDAAPASVTRTNAQRDQRRRILRAIAELVAKRGYADVTVELIVKRARVSYKTFYKHFSGKEECFKELFDSAYESTEKAIRERLDAETDQWADRVVLALTIWIERIVAEPLVARAVIVEAPTVGPSMLERYDRVTKAFVPLFRAGREAHPRGAELPATVEDTLSGSVFWSAYQRLIVGEADSLPELLPELIELVLRTYLGQAEAARIARAPSSRQPAAA
ncbi:MAG TPA: TetR/AcrR family transcriptional regulator [Solirubrobacterales bacterium]|nr:TetR/AcrR family transcriptional regulator [Solirubrobacterales bacterium]